MNKHLKSCCEEVGLTNVNGNFAYGKTNGFDASLAYQAFDAVSPIRVHINCYTTDAQKRNIESALRKKDIKMFRWQFTQYGLMIGLNGFTNKSAAKKLPSVLNETCEILQQNGALGAEFCPVCGNLLTESPHKNYTVEGWLSVTADNECIADLNKKIEAENVDYNNAPNNYGLGFLGALIGGIAGMLSAVLLYLLGYVASISSFVAFALGMFLYGKFGGKKNAMMIVIVTVTSVVCVMSSVFGIYMVVARLAAAEANVDVTAIDAFLTLMKNSEEFRKAFVSDFSLMGVFTVIGIIFEIFVARKKIERPKEIK